MIKDLQSAYLHLHFHIGERMRNINAFPWSQSCFLFGTLYMGSVFILLVVVFSPSCFFSVVTGAEYVYPNFTTSNFKLIDKAGTFLLSRNGTFKAAIFNPGAQKNSFYLCVIHVVSNTVIWSANRDSPISTIGKVNLNPRGIFIQDENGKDKWSTPILRSSVFLLHLTETGNLVLLDRFNSSLWESFLNPTDTLVIGQQLIVGKVLTSSSADNDLSTGNYVLAVNASDTMLQWHGDTYWQLSLDTSTYRNTNSAVEYMKINTTGLYLLGGNGTIVVIQVIFSPSDFRVAKLNYNGQLIVTSFSGKTQKQELVSPRNACRIPYVCHKIGVCTYNAALNLPTCSCPSNFHWNSKDPRSCVPKDSSYSLPSACSSTKNISVFNSSGISSSYMPLGNVLEYFSLDYSRPVTYSTNLSTCQRICTEDCSCLSFFYESSSGSCYALQNELGSFMSSTDPDNDLLGYIKVNNASALGNNNSSLSPGEDFPLIALVLLPITGVSLVIAIGFMVWRRQKSAEIRNKELGDPAFPSSEEMDVFSFPGLPRRFKYEELQAATDNFKNQIGSGGFGTVYKGSLSDNTVVAVKKITNIGIRGKKEFCTEIAIIGNIHHVNLVKLRGFCAHGNQYMLVYEYMNRSSLDRTLLGNGPALEWHERVEIALGTARGLAYLHSSCDGKIIHCDVKPENILLHDNFQAKLSDFGLSKLLTVEQSTHFTTMRGTRGYLAPEWLTSSSISEKTDVYSYGMVLLELVSGRKNCAYTQNPSLNAVNESNGGHTSISSRSGVIYFPLLVLEMHEQERYIELADSRLQGRVLNEDVRKLVRIALCCIHEEPILRPSMLTVVGMLEGRIPVGRPRVESLNFLRFYGRRFAEASTIDEANEKRLGRSSSVTRIYYNSHIYAEQLSGPR